MSTKTVNRFALTMYLAAAVAISGPVIMMIGCATTTQTATIKTIGSLETVTDAAYRSYITLVLQGKIPTNDVPQASHIFDKFQTSALLATIVVKNDTNALAPASLIEESAAAVALFNQFSKK